jgi:hypothetical protein
LALPVNRTVLNSTSDSPVLAGLDKVTLETTTAPQHDLQARSGH